jgi:hypothetical protein
LEAVAEEARSKGEIMRAYLTKLRMEASCVGALVVLLVLAVIARPASAQSPTPTPPGCRSQRWSGTENAQAWITSIVTGTDSTSQAQRSAFNLPAVAASEVAYETDPTVCIAVVAAFRTAVSRHGGAAGGAWVLRVGTTRFIVFDGKQRTGEFEDHYVFDEQLRYLGTISG